MEANQSEGLQMAKYSKILGGGGRCKTDLSDRNGLKS